MSRKSHLAVAALLAACAGRPVPPDAGSFDWLAGCWRAERDGSVFEEMWLPAAPDGMLGAAREVRAGRTVFHEFSRIELRPDGSAWYVAQPAGQAPVEFRLVEHGQGRVAFENPRHDFPTRIEYRYVGLNAIHARASGNIEGGTRSSEYPMERVACEG